MTRNTLILATALSAFALPAQAQVTEARLGANIHDIDWTGLGSGSDKERSIGLNGEIVFEEPEFLKWALSPQPYIGGALNLEGETSYGGAGLLWRQTFGGRAPEGHKRFYLDFTFGLVVHDGELEVMPTGLADQVINGGLDPNTLSPEQVPVFRAELAAFRARQASEIDFGSRVLFREQFTLGYRFSEDWSAHVFVEHLSNGKILVQDAPNEGLDTLGLRVSRHF